MKTSMQSASRCTNLPASKTDSNKSSKCIFFNPICLVKQLRKIFVLLVRTIYQYQARFFHLRTSIVFVFLIFVLFLKWVYIVKNQKDSFTILSDSIKSTSQECDSLKSYLFASSIFCFSVK